MIFTGVFTNAAAIICMAALGTRLGNAIPDKLGDGLLKAVGLAVIFIGISGAFKNENVMLLVVSMVIGTLIGELIDIDKQMNRLGQWMEKKLTGIGADNTEGPAAENSACEPVLVEAGAQAAADPAIVEPAAAELVADEAAAETTVTATAADGPQGKEKPSFSQGFVYATILFCVGSMAIVGSMNSGFKCDHTLLFTKSILDGTTALILGGTLGMGVMFSALPIILYQGSLTLIAFLLGNFMPEIMITEMSAIGSLLILAIGINFFREKPIKVANMIPAMFIPCVYFPLVSIIG